MSPSPSFFRDPPQPFGRRFLPSLLHFTPTASGGVSLARILSQLVAGEYNISNQGEFWKNGDVACKGTADWPWQASGRLYRTFLAAPITEWFNSGRVDLQKVRLILTIRDPRDSVISSYHLTTDVVHTRGAKGWAVETLYNDEQEQVSKWSLEEYVARRFTYTVDNLRTIREITGRLRSENVCCLSYALLCENFPRFLDRLINFLQISPDPAVVDRLLQTEDVRNLAQLNPNSLAHCVKSSPMPGRHKRELLPRTIEHITHEGRDVLEWLASMDEPDLSSIYIN